MRKTSTSCSPKKNTKFCSGKWTTNGRPKSRSLVVRVFRVRPQAGSPLHPLTFACSGQAPHKLTVRQLTVHPLVTILSSSLARVPIRNLMTLFFGVFIKVEMGCPFETKYTINASKWRWVVCLFWKMNSPLKYFLCIPNSKKQNHLLMRCRRKSAKKI